MLACVTVLLASCEKDYTKVDNLVSTTWKCYNIGNVDYALLVFTSTNTVEFWIKEAGEPEYQAGTFSYSVYSNRIHFTYEDEVMFTGLIDKDTITVTIEDETGIFVKE